MCCTTNGGIARRSFSGAGVTPRPARKEIRPEKERDKKLCRVVLLTTAAAGPAFAGAAEQPYPTRPIRMVVPFPPGAASDFLAHVLGQTLGDHWGEQRLPRETIGFPLLVYR